MKLTFANRLLFIIVMLHVFFFTELSHSFELTEEFNGSIHLGNPYGITFTNSPSGKAVVFARSTESRIQYSYTNNFPKDGTLEWWIKVNKGYDYNNYVLNPDNNCALIFTTDIQHGDVTWPGSSWLYVCKNGDISFTIAKNKYGAGGNPSLKAEGTSFKFGDWNRVGISFGSQGKYINLNGSIVASAPTQTEELGAGGNHSQPVDMPTIGESVSGFWQNNQYEGGFEGEIDKFRISSKQQDWKITIPFSNKKTNILQIIPIIGKRGLPRVLDGANWSFTAGSPGHKPCGGLYRIDDSFAIDLNLQNDDDLDKPVHSIERGTVVNVNTKYGGVLIQHNKPLNLLHSPSLSTWYSGYLHMKIDPSVSKGVNVSKGQKIGTISNKSPSNIPNHLHFAIYKINGEFAEYDWSNLTSIDFFNELPSLYWSNISTWYDWCGKSIIVKDGSWWSFGEGPCDQTRYYLNWSGADAICKDHWLSSQEIKDKKSQCSDENNQDITWINAELSTGGTLTEQCGDPCASNCTINKILDILPSRVW